MCWWYACPGYAVESSWGMFSMKYALSRTRSLSEMVLKLFQTCWSVAVMCSVTIYFLPHSWRIKWCYIAVVIKLLLEKLSLSKKNCSGEGSWYNSHFVAHKESIKFLATKLCWYHIAVVIVMVFFRLAWNFLKSYQHFWWHLCRLVTLWPSCSGFWSKLFCVMLLFWGLLNRPCWLIARTL